MGKEFDFRVTRARAQQPRAPSTTYPTDLIYHGSI